MSFTCEECRKKQGLAHGLGWPFFGSYGRCEDCGKTSVCEDLHGVMETEDHGESQEKRAATSPGDWIKAYQSELRREKMASKSVKRSWRIVIAGLKLLLREIERS